MCLYSTADDAGAGEDEEDEEVATSSGMQEDGEQAAEVGDVDRSAITAGYAAENCSCFTKTCL